MSNFVQTYYRISEWIMRFAYLNVLWLLFTVLGLGIFGLLPATVAMFSVVRKWVYHEEDIKMFSLFRKIYIYEFFRVNLLGAILFVIGYLLSIELHILRSTEEVMYFIASFGVVGLFIFYFTTILYFFPVFVHFNLRKRDYIKWPFLIGLTHPVLTLVLFIGISLLLYIIYITVPAMLLFFGGSIPSYLVMLGVAQTFSKFEKTEMN